MIIIDTNVASALMRLELEPKVAQWIDTQDLESLYLTSISIFEIQFGIARAPRGRKRDEIEANLSLLLRDIVPGRLIDLNQAAAADAAAVHVIRGRAKAAHQAPNSLIAGIARHHGAVLATRNVRDFAGLGVKIINPWAQA